MGLNFNDRSTLKLRDGSRWINPNLKRWERALSGHIKMHGGKVKDGCPACEELQSHLKPKQEKV